jgi:DNA topoisomerase-1
MYEYFQKEKEKKKTMTKDEKEALKKEKLALEEKYGYCFLDGHKEKVGNFRIEPPGLFRGRGKHPKTGCLKVPVASSHPYVVSLYLVNSSPHSASSFLS